MVGRLIHAFVNRRSAAIVLLGFASGLPLAVSGDLLTAWLTDLHYDVAKIGMLGLVGLPYALKCLWSPLVDRYVPPRLGRRRGWLAVTQILLIAAILALSVAEPEHRLSFAMLAAAAVAFVSATQDIVIDAWRTDILPPEERGPGSAVFVGGYRLGMIFSGAGALVLVGRFHWSWPTACRVMAMAMGVGLIGTLVAPEPNTPAAPRTLGEAVVMPLRQLLSRRDGWLILGFVLVFKLPEYVAGAMTLPFLLQTGLTKESVGEIRQGMGVAVSVIGAFVGGGIVNRFGIWKSLWIFGILHSVSNLAFLTLAELGPRRDLLIGVIGIENFCIGLTTAGFAAWVMGQCDARYSAFQFALLSGIMALGRVGSGPLAGELAHWLTWPMFFGISALLGLPGLVLLPWMKPAANSMKFEGVGGDIAKELDCTV